MVDQSAPPSADRLVPSGGPVGRAVRRGTVVLGVAAGLATWSLVLGHGVLEQWAAGDALGLALLGLWLAAPYLLVAGALARRRERLAPLVQPAAGVVVAVLVAASWLALWAGRTVWLAGIGQQAAAGDVAVAALRLAGLAAPVVLAVAAWLGAGRPVPVDLDVPA